MAEPANYHEKVYAGVLGKVIGVYLGKPFEGWTNKDIEARLGEIWYYVHDRLNYPLVCADDDISGTFTFVRALADHQAGRDITAEQIGKTWLNYLIEHQTVLWWGGLGVSTEHTAFLRLACGVAAPDSGSIELNGRTVAEQIGAQIFIDGFGLVKLDRSSRILWRQPLTLPPFKSVCRLLPIVGNWGPSKMPIGDTGPTASHPSKTYC